MKRRTFLTLAGAAAGHRLASAAVPPFIPNDGNQSAPVRFIAFGDSGTGDEMQVALARVMADQQKALAFDTALMLGDNIYPDGDPGHLLGKFERPYSELLNRGVRFHAVLGNHDVRRGRDAQLKYPKFNLGGRCYQSFTRGGTGTPLVEFFALDSTNFDVEQGRWLESALAASTARWKIACYHHPIYSSGSTHGSDTRLRSKLEPLFVKYGVAAAFSGHDHFYERIRPQNGVQYFVSGAGGKLRRGNLISNSSLTAVGNDETSSFMFVEATADRLSFKAIDAAGRVFDTGDLLPRAAGRSTAAGSR